VAKKQLPGLSRRLNNGNAANIDPESDSLLEGQSNFRNIAGVVEQSEIARLRRLIFRATKGKSYVFIEEVEE